MIADDTRPRGRLFIHAPNIHGGGGAALLRALMATDLVDVERVFTVDRRFELPSAPLHSLQVRRVEPQIKARLLAERWLATSAGRDDLILCMGNLPPLFKTQCPIVVYIQNRYLVEDRTLAGFSLRARARITAERLWLATRAMNVSRFLVQTPSMRQLMVERGYALEKIDIRPFAAETATWQRSFAARRDVNDDDRAFLYVASGEPHKNHRNLISAWSLLADEGLFPPLRLTLNAQLFPSLSAWISEESARRGLIVRMSEEGGRQGVLRLYREACALIHPSSFESLGLPLIEARQAGLPVLAGELDYVRDVLDPEQTFDPDSPVSIARAVKRFLGIEEGPFAMTDASAFLSSVWSDTYR